jgi:hypothetical protein
MVVFHDLTLEGSLLHVVLLIYVYIVHTHFKQQCSACSLRARSHCLDVLGVVSLLSDSVFMVI